MFKHCGYFLFAPGLKEDDVMEVALDNGADDVVTEEDGSIEVTCDPAAFEALHKAFTDKGWEPEVAEVTWKSDSETVLTGDDAERMRVSSTLWKTSMTSLRFTPPLSLNNYSIQP